MNISVLSVFPELYRPFSETSLVGRAQERQLVNVEVRSFFDFVAPKERIDAPTFGHGAGMLIRPDVVERAITDQEKRYGQAYTVFFSPQGKRLDQRGMRRIAKKAQEVGHLLLVPARYEGMDARVEEHYADEIISIGDFVLMGGDLPAMVLLEGILRLMPGIVGKTESVERDSFTGPFVDYPEYTAPVEWQGMTVPEVVRSGNHGALQAWRLDQAAKKTVRHHFSWLRGHELNDQERAVAQKYIPPHYVALLHSDVLIGNDKVPGTTSVTSLDIHDIARSSATYGIKGFSIVTPLEDQQKLVATLLDFWKNGPGIAYNRVRHDAVKEVSLSSSLKELIKTITDKEGAAPILVATSARQITHQRGITFFDQERVWHENRPVLFVFGTGRGLTQECIDLCDFLLPPIGGISPFRHLSVRSAVAIILDRWLGFNQQERKQDCQDANS